jgi:hypothetical protein
MVDGGYNLMCRVPFFVTLSPLLWASYRSVARVVVPIIRARYYRYAMWRYDTVNGMKQSPVQCKKKRADGVHGGKKGRDGRTGSSLFPLVEIENGN